MTSRMAGYLLLMLALAAATVRAQESASATAEFNAASKAQKISSLNDLATHKELRPPQTMGALIAAGLIDRDENVRTAAVSAAAGRAAGARFGRSPEALAAWRAERPVIDSLRGALLQALNDSSAKVRQGAVVALVNCEYDPDTGARGIVLKDDFAEALASQFDHERETSVRTEIAKTFALTSSNPARRDAVLNKALQDQEPDVIAYGVMGFAGSSRPAPLVAIAAFLKHPDKNVRLQAAQTLSSRGISAKEYLPQLENALASESDPIVRDTIRAAIRTLSGGRAPH